MNDTELAVSKQALDTVIASLEDVQGKLIRHDDARPQLRTVWLTNSMNRVEESLVRLRTLRNLLADLEPTENSVDSETIKPKTTPRYFVAVDSEAHLSLSSPARLYCWGKAGAIVLAASGTFQQMRALRDELEGTAS